MRFEILLVLLLVCGLNSTGISQTKSEMNWEISVGKAYGRYHQFSERYIVKSSGEISYLKRSDENENRAENGKISSEKISQISKMLTLLDLPSAKKIPDNKFNACIMSPHLPNVYFSLKQNDKNYNLTHCNGIGDKREYDYTLILNDSKIKTYEDLRQNVISLFGGIQAHLSALKE